MNHTVFDGLDELYHHAKFGEDRTTPAVGAKCGVCHFLSVTLRVRSAVRSRGALFEQALRCSLQADFDEVFSVFSEGTALSEALHDSHLCRQVVPQFSRNCRQK